MTPHERCGPEDHCGRLECPGAIASGKRADARHGEWAPLVLKMSPGGLRHYLDGQPVYCGTPIELQAIEYKNDRFGDFTSPLQRGEVVRYEANLAAARHGHALVITLYGDLAGHQFEREAHDGMRFRWPKEKR